MKANKVVIFAIGGLVLAVIFTAFLNYQNNWVSDTRSINRIIVSPNFASDGTIFASGTHHTKGWKLIEKYGGVFKSTDGGDTWRQLDNELFQADPDFTFSPDYAQDRTIFAVVSQKEGSVHESNDRGESWHKLEIVDGPRNPELIISPQYKVDHTIFTLDRKAENIFKSTDKARTWLKLPQTPGSPQDLVISPDFATDQTLFLVAVNDIMHGLYRSSNGGKSWIKLLEKQDGYIDALSVSPDYAVDRTVAFADSDVLYQSRDGGQTWKRRKLPESESISNIRFSPDYAVDNTYMVVGTFDIFKTNNGGKDLEPMHIKGIEADRIQALAFSTDFASDNTVFIGTRTQTYPDRAWRPNVDKSGVFRSVDGGKHWRYWDLAPQ